MNLHSTEQANNLLMFSLIDSRISQIYFLPQYMQCDYSEEIRAQVNALVEEIRYTVLGESMQPLKKALDKHIDNKDIFVSDYYKYLPRAMFECGFFGLIAEVEQPEDTLSIRLDPKRWVKPYRTLVYGDTIKTLTENIVALESKRKSKK